MALMWVKIRTDDPEWHAIRKSEAYSLGPDDFTTLCDLIEFAWVDDDVEREPDGLRCVKCETMIRGVAGYDYETEGLGQT